MLVDPAHGWVLIGGSSSDAPSLRQLRSSDNCWHCYGVRSASSRSNRRSGAALARSARVNAFRRSAASRQPGCSHAPRPGRTAPGSGTTAPSSRTTRRRPPGELRSRQPMQVRTLVVRLALTSTPGWIRTDDRKCSPAPSLDSRGRRAGVPPRCLSAHGCPWASPQESTGPECSVSGRMSIRHPVRRAASRAFWPSRPIARDS